MRFPGKSLAISLLPIFLFDICQLKPTFVFHYSNLLKSIIFLLFFWNAKPTIFLKTLQQSMYDQPFPDPALSIQGEKKTSYKKI